METEVALLQEAQRRSKACSRFVPLDYYVLEYNNNNKLLYKYFGAKWHGNNYDQMLLTDYLKRKNTINMIFLTVSGNLLLDD